MNLEDNQVKSASQPARASDPEQKIKLPDVKFDAATKQLQDNLNQNGFFFRSLHEFDEALKYFDASIKLLPTDFMPIYNKSLCHFDLAEIDEAKDEVEKSLRLCPVKHELPLRHHRIDCIYNQNYFEDALVNANNTLRLNSGHFNYVECAERIHAIRSTIDYCIGENAGPCLFNLRAAINNLDELRKSDSKPFKRVCGVSSDPDIVKRKLKPLLKKRIEENRKMINNVYLLEVAHDYKFLNQLATDKRLHLHQTEHTNEHIRSIVNPTVNRITKWRNMLTYRQPIYSKKFNMIQNARKAAEYHVSIMNRIQLQTRRDVFEQLVKVRKLAAEGKFEALADYTISLLQNYYSIKTNRIFPRIFEFRNELCNIVSISFLNQIKIPRDLMTQTPFHRFSYLIGAKAHQKVDDTVVQQPNFEFGDRDAFTRLHSVDTSYLTYKHRVQMLEQLIEVIDTPIEKCFISYEVSRLHFSQIKIDEARTMARKVVENSEICGNFVWLYLGHLQTTRCDAVQQNLSRIQQKLKIMQKLCRNLNDYITHFTNVAIKLNQTDIDTKEREEREKREELEREEELRQERRDIFLRMSVDHENQPGLTPQDVRRHSEGLRPSIDSQK